MNVTVASVLYWSSDKAAMNRYCTLTYQKIHYTTAFESGHFLKSINFITAAEGVLIINERFHASFHSCFQKGYRKIPKISPEAYIFQRPFLRGLFLEGLIFEGAYVRREICVSKSIGLACSGKEIYHFCFVLLCIRGQILSTSPPGGLYSEGRFNGGFFALRFWGAYIWRGLFSQFIFAS